MQRRLRSVGRTAGGAGRPGPRSEVSASVGRIDRRPKRASNSTPGAFDPTVGSHFSSLSRISAPGPPKTPPDLSFRPRNFSSKKNYRFLRMFPKSFSDFDRKMIFERFEEIDKFYFFSSVKNFELKKWGLTAFWAPGSEIRLNGAKCDPTVGSKAPGVEF